MNQKNRRIKYFINPEVQIGYIKFLFLYWFVYFSISIIGFLGIFIVQLNADDTREVTYRLVQIYQNNFIYLFIFMLFHFSASLLMGLYFFRSFSHRVCGPIYNIEKRIKEMNENPDLDNYSEIKTRTNDYFQPLVDQLNQLLKTKKIIKADEPKKNGFGLVELLVAVGLVGILAAGMTGMLTGTMKQQKGIQAKDQQLQITSEVRALLNDKTACANSFAPPGSTNNPQTGFTVNEIKDFGNNPRFTAGQPDRSGLLRISEIGVSGWVQDPAFPTQGNANLNLKLTKIGDTQSVRELKPNVITLKVKRDGAGNVSECYSIGQQSDGFWQPSAAELNTIFYPAGSVAIGTTTVNGNNLRVHSPAGQGAIYITGPSEGGVDGSYSGLYLGNDNSNNQTNSWGLVHKNDLGNASIKDSFQIVRWKAGVPMAVPLAIREDNGYVGIGTTDPKASMSVLGGMRANKGMPLAVDNSNVGYAFGADGDTGLFADGGANAWSGSSLSFYVDGGQSLRVSNTAALCDDNNHGGIRYSQANKVIEFCNKDVGAWAPVGGAVGANEEVKVGNSGAACAPANEGALRYNNVIKKMEFCDGNNTNTWKALDIGGSPLVLPGRASCRQMSTQHSTGVPADCGQGWYVAGTSEGWNQSHQLCCPFDAGSVFNPPPADCCH